MSLPSPARPRFTLPTFLGRLGVRQALLLSSTLLPIGVILLIQIGAVEREADGRIREALTGATLAAGGDVVRKIEAGRGAARTLAAIVSDLADDSAACSRALEAFVAAPAERARYAALVPPDGVALCTSNGQPHFFPMTPLRAELVANPRPYVAATTEGQVTGEAAIILSHPVMDSAGGLLGFLSISLPHRGFLGIEATEGRARPIALITFDAEGRLLTGSAGLEDAALRIPADRSLKALASTDRPVAFTATSVAGAERVYSVVPIVEKRIFLLGSWRVEDMGAAGRLGGLPPMAFAVLMWLASLGTAIYGAERLVSRHVRALGRSMTAFAGGDRRVALPDLRHAPEEMRAAGDAYARMTAAILQDEAELEDALRKKDMLLREVHHRVKNNLQLIASIMNLQMRKARSVEARTLLRGLHDRVMSLATIHRELYQTTGETDIQLDELLADITRQVVKLATGQDRRFDVVMEFAPVVMTPDQAVPLALLLTEALTNAIKYAGAVKGRPSRLVVTLTQEDDDMLRLEVCNTLPVAGETGYEAGGEAPESTGLGSQLLTAFAHQVGGKLETAGDDTEYRLILTFRRRTDLDDEDDEPEPEDAPQEA